MFQGDCYYILSLCTVGVIITPTLYSLPTLKRATLPTSICPDRSILQKGLDLPFLRTVAMRFLYTKIFTL